MKLLNKANCVLSRKTTLQILLSQKKLKSYALKLLKIVRSPGILYAHILHNDRNI